jgi:hypothetical protein
MTITPRVRRPDRDRALRHLRQQQFDHDARQREQNPVPPSPLAEAMAAFWEAFRAPLPSSPVPVTRTNWTGEKKPGWVR